MAKIRSFTSLEQSKKLAEILPLESADMLFQLGEDKYADSIRVPLTKKHWEQTMPDINPCWSLSALLDALPEKYTELIKEGGMYRIIIKDSYMTCLFDNPVDACCELIVRLHERKILLL